MVAEMLSQEEINALLGSVTQDDALGAMTGDLSSEKKEGLSIEEIDALGEMGNISMGTAATTLFTLLNHKVLITTPKVEVLSWNEFVETVTDDLTAVAVDYTEGFIGSNLMILKDHDVKVIADLMMGGVGNYVEGPVTDLHLSAIAESMNQMIGSSSTSMSQIFNKRIDISPPQAIKVNDNLEKIFQPKGDVVKISFRLQIEENIIDSELMQVLPIHFAKELIGGLLHPEGNEKNDSNQEVLASVVPEPKAMPQITHEERGHVMQDTYVRQESMMRPDVDIKAPKFQSFDTNLKVYPKENMDILMDVSLEVSVELGRTNKKIKEILEYGPGSIIELNRLVGEPVDVLVNGKFIANGEVVVIDENFGIRITDIINPENRI